MFKKSDFEKHLKERWAERGISLSDDSRMGVSIHELVEHSKQRSDGREMPFLDLWVSILDEHISWFISLEAITNITKNKNGTEFERSTYLVLSKIIGDSTAIRHLILLGFDTAARALLRSLQEYMEMLVILIHEPELSAEFMKSDTPETSKIFWEKHLRGGKARRTIKAVWKRFFINDDTETFSFADWAQDSNPILSGLSHPSIMGGLFTAIPLQTQYGDENWLGTWGEKSDMSVETIFMYLKTALPILLLSRGFPFEGFEEYQKNKHVYDESDEFHQHVRIGRDILASVILSLCQESNAEHVFPNLDLSIFPGDDPKKT